MSFWKRLFSGPEPPTADEVVTTAIERVAALEPSAELERRGDAIVVVRIGGRDLQWRLTDVIRLAADDPSWREGLASMAKEVVQQLRVEVRPEMAPTKANVVVLVWPRARLDALAFEVVAEDVVPELALVYGVRGGGKIRFIRPHELEVLGLEVRALRERAVANMSLANELGLDFLSEGLPILTNQVGHPSAASLLADKAHWKKLYKRLGAVLVAVPAPTRLFIAPDDHAMRRLLTDLVARSFEIEEETLTRDILRFDKSGWSLAD